MFGSGLRVFSLPVVMMIFERLIGTFGSAPCFLSSFFYILICSFRGWRFTSFFSGSTWEGGGFFCLF
jgi:hypothetical protein